MNKIEKLREVNATIKKILIEIETHMFIENINVERSKKSVMQQKAEVELN